MDVVAPGTTPILTVHTDPVLTVPAVPEADTTIATSVAEEQPSQMPAQGGEGGSEATVTSPKETPTTETQARCMRAHTHTRAVHCASREWRGRCVWQVLKRRTEAANHRKLGSMTQL